MLDLLIAALSGVLALVFLFVGGLLVLSSGRTGLGWVYAAVVVVAFLVTLSRASRRPEPAPWTRRVRRGMVSACLALFLGAAIATLGYLAASRPPKQQAVAAILASHRADLDRLKDMALGDRLETVVRFGEAFSRPEQPLIFTPPSDSGLSPDRAAEYTRLMRAVDSERIDVWPDGTVHLSVAGWGGANRGWRMSIAFAATQPKPLVPGIDGFSGAPSPGAPNYAYSRLDGSWYVYMIR